MPRQARLDIPGALHHIMVRGINKATIFKDDQDRSRFLDRLAQNVIHTQSVVYAWVVMENHVHLLIRSGKPGISALMQRLLTWYAQYFNRRHGRTGHLFENRYKSILCEEERYLLALVRYIHLNPIRAKVVKTLKDLDRYAWSGHRMILGKVEEQWMGGDYIRGCFGEGGKKAIEKYCRFMAEGIGEGRNSVLTGGGLIRSQGGWSQVLAFRRNGKEEASDERILGGGDFVEEVLREAEDRQLRQTRLRRKGRSIDDLIREECRKRKVSEEELRKGGRRRRVSEARGEIVYRGREELGLSGAEMARSLGVNTSSINRVLTKRDEFHGD